MTSNCSRLSRNCVALQGAWRLCLFATLMPAIVYSETPVDVEIDTLPEIVVTARKVEESVQDIPMSVQVLSGDLIDVADLTHLFDLQFNVPGLVVNNLGLNGAGFSLRGVASVATHLNGVYSGTSNLSITRMFDLARVEVLKGPQGTLYGRNATGGSINVITRSPEDDFSADIEAAHGSFATTRIQGHVNLPFGNSAFRLAYVGSGGDGFIRNSVDDRKFAEKDFWGVRGSLRVNVTDELQVNVMAQHVTDDGASGELWLPQPDFLANPADIRLTTVTLLNPFLISRTDNISVNIDYDLGFANLHSVTGYARNVVHDLDDCAGLPVLVGCVRGVRPAKYDQWSQEFQLASQSDTSIDWLVGAFYFESDSSENFHLLRPLLNPNPLNDHFSTRKDTAHAIFGQSTWHMTERWSATGGLRLNSEGRRKSRIGTGVQDSPTLVTADNDWNNVSWRLDLDYAVSDSTRLYAGVSTGFKSGGITIRPFGVLDDFGPEELTAYEAGVKSQWLDRRLTLNGAAFYYDFRDLQVNTFTISQQTFIFETDNAAKAEIYGIDSDVLFKLSDRLTLSAALLWLPKREFVEYRNDRFGDTLSGNKLTRAPEWTATGAVNYSHPLRRIGNFSARLEYNYRSEFFYTTDNDVLFSQDSFGLLNVFLKFEPMSEKWYVFASGRNLGDVDYFNQVFLQSSPGYPDTYEAGFGYRF